MKNSRVIVFNDNQVVMNMVNKQTSKCDKCMKLIRILVLDNLITNRQTFVCYVSSRQNVLADTLSRMDMVRFCKYAPRNMAEQATPIPEAIWPIEKFGMHNQLIQSLGSLHYRKLMQAKQGHSSKFTKRQQLSLIYDFGECNLENN